MAGAPDFKATRSRDDSTAEERRDFKLAVLALDGRCLVHDDLGDCQGPLHAHHAVPRRILKERGLPQWLPESGFAACQRGHFNHHSRSKPISLARVPERCVRFAQENGLEDLLARFYV
jgi:hypothetical protein